jgi:hypothetical protein
MGRKNKRLHFLIMSVMLITACQTSGLQYYGLLNFDDTDIPFWDYVLEYQIFDSKHQVISKGDLDVYMFNHYKIPQIKEAQYLQIYISSVNTESDARNSFIPENNSIIDLSKAKSGRLPITHITSAINFTYHSDKNRSASLKWKTKKNVDFYRIDFYMNNQDEPFLYMFVPEKYSQLTEKMITSSTMLESTSQLTANWSDIFFLGDKKNFESMWKSNISCQIIGFKKDSENSTIVQMTLPLRKVIYQK